MSKLLKKGFNIFVNFVGVIILVILLITVGYAVAPVVYPSNQSVAFLSFICLTMLFGYLIIRAEEKGPDGLDSFGVATLSSWLYGAIATAMIFLMMSVSQFFLIINLLIFVIITTILALRIQRDPSKYYLHTWDESGRKIALDDLGQKIKIKKSVFLARNTLDILV